MGFSRRSEAREELCKLLLLVPILISFPKVRQALEISLYSTQLEPKKISQRAEILPGSLPLKVVFEAELAEIDERKGQEYEAVQIMEEKRAEEIERGRREIILEQSSREITQESEGLPVCTRTPRMLITGKTVAY
jgi:hypothetical protein